MLGDTEDVVTLHPLRWSVGAALIAGLATSLAASQPATPLPLIIEHATIIPATSDVRPAQIAVSVQNTGPRTIVAWGISAQVTYADGTSHENGLGTDGVAIPRTQPAAALSPGGRYTLRSVLSSSRTIAEITNVSARPTYVVFDDDSGLGDDQSIDFVFVSRAMNLRAWRRVEKAFADARAALTDPVDVLARVGSSLDAVRDSEFRDSLPYQQTIRDVRGFLAQAPNRDIAPLVDEFVKKMRARLEGLEAHSRRR